MDILDTLNAATNLTSCRGASTLIRTVSRILTVSAAAVLFAGPTPLAQGQARNPSAKPNYAPRALPLTSFYDAPDPLPSGHAGELIRSEPFDEYRLSYEVSTIRILYHSRSPNGTDVPASGVVLLPDKTSPAGGWPVIAWAHGFSGSARQCAPSLLQNLTDGPLLSMYVSLGYAVVAPDYAGLGTHVPHSAFDTRSNAMDVINAVQAARAAVPQLGTRWVVAGYRHGSAVAIGVAEAETDLRDPNYLGAVGISGFADPEKFFEHLAEGPDYYMLVFLTRGVEAVYPAFHSEDILTDKANGLYEYAAGACDASLASLPPANEMVRPGWKNNRYVKEFFSRNTLGLKPTFGPQLLISAANAADASFALNAAQVSHFCQQKDRVLFVQYPALNPSAVLGNSVSEQVSWIKARFSGLPAPDNCGHLYS
jgi:hypothetical protein